MAQKATCLFQPRGWHSVLLAYQTASREEKRVILTQTTTVPALCSSARRKGMAFLCLGPRDYFCLVSLGEDRLPAFPLPGTKRAALIYFQLPPGNEAVRFIILKLEGQFRFFSRRRGMVTKFTALFPKGFKPWSKHIIPTNYLMPRCVFG